MWKRVVAVLLAAVAGSFGAPSFASAAPSVGDIALAQELEVIADDAVPTQARTVPGDRMLAAMFGAAARLDPTEPRYLRMQGDALLAAGDRSAALDVIKAYTHLVPDDRSAQAQLIDLYVEAMQTAEQ